MLSKRGACSSSFVSSLLHSPSSMPTSSPSGPLRLLMAQPSMLQQPETHQDAAAVVMHASSALSPPHLSTVTVSGPIPDAARTGRHKQRYAPSGERLVAGCIPVRVKGDGFHSVEVLLISSRNGRGFCFPKGGWEDDETVEIAAKRETMEEAGVRGELEEPCLGLFPFQSGKGVQTTKHQGRCLAHMYILHVAEVLEVWPEIHERQRIWVPLLEAVQRCRHEWMREALLTWVQRKGWTLHVSEALLACSSTAAQPAGTAAAAGVETLQVVTLGATCQTSLSSAQVGSARAQALANGLLPANGVHSPTCTVERTSVTFASANSLSTELSETPEPESSLARV